MHDARTVRAVESVADLDGDGQCLGDGHDRGSVQLVREGFALEILEDQIVEVTVVPDVEQRADMRIVQRGDGARLVLQPRP